MARNIVIGEQDFETLQKYDCFYVDKTKFIQEWWKKRDRVTLIKRPRRFGKTLNMSMLNCFFSNRFEGLEVWNDEDLRKEQGKWPVIFLSFSTAKGGTREETRLLLNEKIQIESRRFRSIWKIQCFRMKTESRLCPFERIWTM